MARPNNIPDSIQILLMLGNLEDAREAACKLPKGAARKAAFAAIRRAQIKTKSK
jgi:hypothetical protein